MFEVSYAMGSVDVDRPVREVWEYWSDPESYPDFLGGVDEIRWIGPDRARWTVHGRGGEHEFEAMLTEKYPLQRMTWVVVGQAGTWGAITFHRLSQTSTRIIAQLALYTPDGSTDQQRLVRRIMNDLERFKVLAELPG